MQWCNTNQESRSLGAGGPDGLRETNAGYAASVAVPCREGVLGIETSDTQWNRSERLPLTPDALSRAIPQHIGSDGDQQLANNPVIAA